MTEDVAGPFTETELALIKEVNDLIEPFGVVSGLGPNAVAVMGDGRSVGASVTIRFTSNANIAELSTMITNRVRGVARVLMDV